MNALHDGYSMMETSLSIMTFFEWGLSLDLFFGNPHSMADAMQLISALKVEQDLQEAWRQEREREKRDEVECDSEQRRVKSEL